MRINSFHHYYKCKHLLNLQHSLAKVLALEHSNKSIGGAVNSLGDGELGLDATVRQPLLQVLLVLLGISRAKLGVADEETLHGDLLGDELHETLDSGLLAGRGVVG